MQILIIGSENIFEECKKVIAEEHHLQHHHNLPENIKDFDVIIDTQFDNDSSRLAHYNLLSQKTIIVSAVKKSLLSLTLNNNNNWVGMNLLPTFINRKLAECTIVEDEKKDAAANILLSLGWNANWVENRVGMVTPRIIFMIINEACFTLQEGTASIADIDTAMKLGTNYPYGPFEWADKIGITNVYEVLQAVYEDTKDERYKICPLLKTYYLKQQPFYN